MSGEENSAEPAPNPAPAAEADNGPRTFKFPSHQSHMVTLAKMCQKNSDYTDCVIQCAGTAEDIEEEDGEAENKLRAHRLVLGAVSPFMKLGK